MQKIETAHPALALESQYYHVIFDQSPIAYVIWDRDLITGPLSASSVGRAMK